MFKSIRNFVSRSVGIKTKFVRPDSVEVWARQAIFNNSARNNSPDPTTGWSTTSTAPWGVTGVRVTMTGTTYNDIHADTSNAYIWSKMRIPKALWTASFLRKMKDYWSTAALNIVDNNIYSSRNGDLTNTIYPGYDYTQAAVYYYWYIPAMGLTTVSPNLPDSTWVLNTYKPILVGNMISENLNTLRTIVMPNVCSVAGADGVSNAMVESSELGTLCREWEAVAGNITMVDEVKREWCVAHPNTPECRCLARQTIDPHYATMKLAFNAPDKCWYAPCVGGLSSANGLFVTNSIFSETCPLIDCRNILIVIGENINLTDVKQNLICDVDDIPDDEEEDEEEEETTTTSTKLTTTEIVVLSSGVAMSLLILTGLGVYTYKLAKKK